MAIADLILDCFSNKMIATFLISLLFRDSKIWISGVLSYTLQEEYIPFLIFTGQSILLEVISSFLFVGAMHNLTYQRCRDWLFIGL